MHEYGDGKWGTLVSIIGSAEDLPGAERLVWGTG